MKLTLDNPRNRLYFISASILVAGLLCAAMIHLHAETAEDNALLNEFEYSKRYQHDLELYGGKANVVATEITNWFTGLWHGKRLAYTIAGMTVLISGGFFFAARHAPDGMKPGSGNETAKRT